MLSSTLDPSPLSERGARVRFSPPLVFLIGILAGFGVQHWVKRAAVPIDRTIAIVIGVSSSLLASPSSRWPGPT
jgi:hypothetical protein